MHSPASNDDQEIRKPKLSKTLFFSAAIYHGLLAIIFLFGFVLVLTNHPVTQKYVEQYDLPQLNLIFISGVSALCFICQITGIIQLWRFKIIGLYIYIISFVAIIALQLWIQDINWINFTISGSFFILLLIQSKQFHRKKNQ